MGFCKSIKNSIGLFPSNSIFEHLVGMWPSLVGHCVRDAGVARSNRAIPTIYYDQPPTTDAILKIGRYMAMIMPPTTPPRKTIIKGSRSAVMASTAVSTSSS
jgi:hypothetical protein